MESAKNERTRITAPVIYLLLGTGLLLLVGCATGGTARVKQMEQVPDAAPAAAVEPAPSIPAGPSVIRLTDGRQGFRITEPSRLNAQGHQEFDQAGAMMKEADYGRAVELLEKVIAQSPDLTAPHINIAIAYNNLNKPEQAEQHLKKALELISGHPAASNEYGLMLRKAGRFAESRKIYQDSLAVFPEYAPVHKNLAILCDLYLKDAACAVEHYEIYAKAMPKDPQVRLWLADLQSRGHHVASLKAPGE